MTGKRRQKRIRSAGRLRYSFCLPCFSVAALPYLDLFCLTAVTAMTGVSCRIVEKSAWFAVPLPGIAAAMLYLEKRLVG